METTTIAGRVEVITDGHTLTLQEGETSIACSESETFGLLGALRFSLGLKADTFEVQDHEDGPIIELDHPEQAALLDILEAARAAHDADDDENWE
jgi:hypothetical protein